MIKKLYKEFKKLKTDKERWKWIIENQDKNITIYLDNDDTFGIFDDDKDEDGDPRYTLSFDSYLGWSEGVVSLLDSFGIKNELV